MDFSVIFIIPYTSIFDYLSQLLARRDSTIKGWVALALIQKKTWIGLGVED